MISNFENCRIPNLSIIEPFFELVIPKLAQPSWISNVWWNDRDQRPRKPLYSNFDKNLIFFRIFNRHIGSVIYNFVCMIHTPWSETSKTLVYQFWHHLIFFLIFHCYIVLVILNFEILIGESDQRPRKTLYSNYEKNLSFFEFVTTILYPPFWILKV